MTSFQRFTEFLGLPAVILVFGAQPLKEKLKCPRGKCASHSLQSLADNYSQDFRHLAPK
eukprot:m.59297 g.59297  ORF g.59297 m.59297 type:complete len:59 (+) comp34880_c0_seq6:689-865(+)